MPNIFRVIFFALFSVAVAALYLVPASAAAVITVDTTSTITVNVKCAGQGQVDADHRITLTIDRPGTTSLDIPIDVQKSTTASAIALQVKSGLTSNGIAATGPTETSGYPAETAYDVKLPDGYKMRGVKVEKKSSSGGWSADDGHLKVTSTPKVKSSSGLVPPLVPVPGFSSFTFKENTWIGQVKVVEIIIRGVNASGVAFEYSHEWTYDGMYPVPTFTHVGQFLQRKGMTVSFPSNSEMSVDLTTSTLNVYEVDFVIHADASVNPQQLWTSDVEFVAN